MLDAVIVMIVLSLILVTWHTWLLYTFCMSKSERSWQKPTLNPIYDLNFCKYLTRQPLIYLIRQLNSHRENFLPQGTHSLVEFTGKARITIAIQYSLCYKRDTWRRAFWEHCREAGGSGKTSRKKGVAQMQSDHKECIVCTQAKEAAGRTHRPPSPPYSLHYKGARKKCPSKKQYFQFFENPKIPIPFLAYASWIQFFSRTILKYKLFSTSCYW